MGNGCDSVCGNGISDDGDDSINGESHDYCTIVFIFTRKRLYSYFFYIFL